MNSQILNKHSKNIRPNLKIVAILSVLTAHVSLYSCDIEGCISLERILIFWGSTGVGIFFAIAGKDWPSKRKSLELTAKEYTSYYLIPTLFSGLAIYTSLIIRKGNAGISLLDFLTGNGSYLWFVPVFLILKFLTRYEPRGLIISVILTISTVVYLHEEPVGLLGLNPHLNIFYWVPYLILGKYFGNLERSIFKLMSLCMIKATAVLLTITPFMACIFMPNIRLNYFSFDLLFLSFSFYSGVSILLQSIELSGENKVNKTEKSRFYKFLSNQTLFIYLWHMAFAGLASRILGHNLFILLGTPSLVVAMFMLYVAIARVKSAGLYLAMGLKQDTAR